MSDQLRVDLATKQELNSAILVIFNSLLQMVLFSPYAILFCDVLGVRAGADLGPLKLDYPAVARAVCIVSPAGHPICLPQKGLTTSSSFKKYLGIPLAAGGTTRFLALSFLSDKRRQRFFHYFGLFGMLGLLYVIVVLFCNQGRQIIQNIGTVFRICVPFAPFPPLFFLVFIVELTTSTLNKAHHVLHDRVDHNVPVVLEVLKVALGQNGRRIRKSRHASIHGWLKQCWPSSFPSAQCFGRGC